MRIQHTTAGPKDSTKHTAIMKDAAADNGSIALLDPVSIRRVHHNRPGAIFSRKLSGWVTVAMAHPVGQSATLTSFPSPPRERKHA